MKQRFHGSGTSQVCLFYTVATVFQLYHGGDIMYAMRRRKPVPTILLTQGIFNLLHHIGIELAFDDAVSYTRRENGLQHRSMLWQWSVLSMLTINMDN